MHLLIMFACFYYKRAFLILFPERRRERKKFLSDENEYKWEGGWNINASINNKFQFTQNIVKKRERGRGKKASLTGFGFNWQVLDSGWLGKLISRHFLTCVLIVKEFLMVNELLKKLPFFYLMWDFYEKLLLPNELNYK